MFSDKPGRGRNKTRRKQREYKEHCRKMRISGHITDVYGNWTLTKPATISKSIEEVRRMTCAK